MKLQQFTLFIVTFFLQIITNSFQRQINTIYKDFSSSGLDTTSFQCKFNDDDSSLYISSSNDNSYKFDVATLTNQQNFSGQHNGNSIDTIENIDKYDIVFTTTKVSGQQTHIWQISTGTIQQSLNYGAQYIKASSDKEMVCIPDYNSANIYIINTNDLSEKQVITGDTNINSCEFINDDTQIIVAVGTQAKIYNLSDSQQNGIITFGGNIQLALQNPTYKTQFLGVQSSGVVEIRDISSSIIASKTLTDSIKSGQYSPNGHWIIIAGVGASLNAGLVLCSQTLDIYETINTGENIHFGSFTSDSLKVCLSGAGNYASIYEAACVPTEYADGSDQCVACELPCVECKSQTYCISCTDSANRSPPECDCNIGFYEDGSGNCQPCDINCQTCVTSSDNCLSCKDQSANSSGVSTCQCLNSYFIGLSGYCEICEDGKYELNQVCLDCDPKCETCSGNPTNCQLCVDQNTKGGPLCECKFGYYLSQETNVCTKCVYPCQTCSSLTECDTCVRTGVQYLDAPSCQCSIGYYQPPDQNKCLICDEKCVECTHTSLQGGYCTGTVCKDDSLLFPNCDNKSTGLFSVLVNGIYYEELCSPQCESCIEDKDNCTACQGENRVDQLPDCACIEGFHDYNGQVQDCIQILCDSRCFKCDLQGMCTQCKINSIQNDKGECECMKGYERYESDENCMEQCPKNQFYNPLLKECANCHYYQESICLAECPENQPEIEEKNGSLYCKKKESINRTMIMGVLLFGAILVLVFLYAGLQNCCIRGDKKPNQKIQNNKEELQKIIPENDNKYKKITLPNGIKITRKLTLPQGVRKFGSENKV